MKAEAKRQTEKESESENTQRKKKRGEHEFYKICIYSVHTYAYEDSSIRLLACVFCL